MDEKITMGKVIQALKEIIVAESQFSENNAVGIYWLVQALQTAYCIRFDFEREEECLTE